MELRRLRRPNPEERFGPQEEGAQIEARGRFRDPPLVGCDELLQGPEEEVGPELGEAESPGGGSEAAGVDLRTEQPHTPVGGAVGLQPLEDRL
ncbi:hypothetical protein GCM10025866_33670 [Naasia aerilata]|uniref:Uncharacterized protein n=1 Tax=Naasia aerilata TaxID=1162966 RepID=A0ABM8GGI2_9MICO|nr:hypothetical protein GCM10025866_33670 [Naasia aerilata]